jgi:hypothetical protein
VGAASAYVAVGVCEEGADITLEPLTHPIRCDGGGGSDGGPVEFIELNAVTRVRFSLVPFAGNYVNALRRLAMASAAEGVHPVPGTLFGLNSRLPGLYLPYGNAAEVDGPWFFQTNRVAVPGNNRVSTKESKVQFEFFGFTYYNPALFTSVSALTLYTRAAPP